MCANGNGDSGTELAGMPHRLDDLGLEKQELLVLDLFRCFCLEFADPTTKSWVAAYAHAEEVMGLERGPVLAHLTANVLLALRRERQRAFNFIDPRCEKCKRRVLPTEIALIEILRATKMANRGGMLSALAILADGEEAPDTLAAALTLAETMMTGQWSQPIEHAGLTVH